MFLSIIFAEGYEKLAQAKEGVFTNLGQNDDAFDMFADDDENGHANPASGGSELVAGDNNNIVSQPSESKLWDLLLNVLCQLSVKCIRIKL